MNDHHSGSELADVVPALRVSSKRTFRYGVERAADVAIERSQVAVFVGAVHEYVVVCAGDCCIKRRGAVIVVPDVAMVEAHANGLRAIATTWQLQRDDGREAYLFRLVKGVTAREKAR
ncbi:hypothetical protein FNH05_13400 [Amycolatopsis rhizosphaerae]|uniref:Uncharacterized protein n=1 Tax=Amycolatopsis rhizosphaerae TaxID=2053003 RepID=A0A558CTP9_9PSEU|nr:hypothetical protein [Amycolatopsis rhizosphaerae]TVT52130.1 hypothetical protein FNH05_13400 [Amycolatopsis rhizosphaerae]